MTHNRYTLPSIGYKFCDLTYGLVGRCNHDVVNRPLTFPNSYVALGLRDLVLLAATELCTRQCGGYGRIDRLSQINLGSISFSHWIKGP